MKDIHKERLRILRNKLARLARSKKRTFDISTWAVFSSEKRLSLSGREIGQANFGRSLRTLKLPEGFCGTTACAVGHACFIPSLREQGLRLVRDGDDGIMPYYRGRFAFRAVESFFGLSEDTADWLFGAFSYPKREERNPAAVVKRIDAVLSGAHAA